MRQRWFIPALILGCLAASMLACYGRALFLGEQFAYRDAAHYYYPLHQRVQAEWDAGRWPLWEPEENSGMPLLGNPTAAVLYPGKLIFAVVSYPLGARLYVVGHTLLAFGAMLALLRGWKTSWTGSALGALAYAFSGPILFQYCNIIYLVGAAWLPLGFRAVDRWVRLGRRWALLELAVVLAMETLGGDPEAAYLTGVCAAGYAAALAWGRREPMDGRRRGWFVAATIVSLVVLLTVWIVGTLTLARWAAVLRPISAAGQPSLPLPGVHVVRSVILAAWGVIALSILARWRRFRGKGARPVLVPMLAGLVLSALLAGAVSAAQLLPVLEFTGQSGRAAGDGPHDIFPFSLHPLRVVEFFCPNLFGTPFHGNRLWGSGPAPRARPHPKGVWVPTLYVGALTVVLVLGTLRFRGAAPWRCWMMAVAAFSLLGSFGEYGGPIWIARFYPKAVALIGPHDPHDVASIRFDRRLRDGDGSIYACLANALPGFRQFRFPSKLLTFTVLALTALAGQGWDALARGEPGTRRRTAAWAGVLLAITLSVLAMTTARRTRRIVSSHGWKTPSSRPSSARSLTLAAPLMRPEFLDLAQAARGIRPGDECRDPDGGTLPPPRLDPRGFVILSADLATANARYVTTVPQSIMDSTPEVLTEIERAEKEKPSPGPYRVHRVPLWSPFTPVPNCAPTTVPATSSSGSARRSSRSMQYPSACNTR